jgi:hypothetical protein
VFAPHFEGFDLFMTWVACHVLLWDIFLCRTGIREIKNQRKEAKDRNKKYFLGHRSSSFLVNPLFGSQNYFIATIG